MRCVNCKTRLFCFVVAASLRRPQTLYFRLERENLTAAATVNCRAELRNKRFHEITVQFNIDLRKFETLRVG